MFNDEYWNKLIHDNGLEPIIQELNEIHDGDQNTPDIKELCCNIHDDYLTKIKILDDLRIELTGIFEKFKGILLHSSRVKELDSLLIKIITKLHENIFSSDSLYTSLCKENYDSIITDLTGIRLILSFNGDWKSIHSQISEIFTFLPVEQYPSTGFIPHSKDGKGIIAEIPTAYHSIIDDISEYKNYGFKTVVKGNGYRSIHYILSYKNTYIELQLRSLYSEAWNDCDHNYVYKKEFNSSHPFLAELSNILCKLSNLSNDLGCLIRDVYNSESVKINKIGDKFITSQKEVLNLKKYTDNINSISKDFADLENKFQTEETQNE